MEQVIEVVAALISNDDKFLICQRPLNKSRPLLWEFAGGKVETGESKEAALIRECKEELGIIIVIDSEFISVDYQYPDIAIHMTVYRAHVIEGIPTLIEHNDLKWISLSEAKDYEFCPADIHVVNKLLSKL